MTASITRLLLGALLLGAPAAAQPPAPDAPLTLQAVLDLARANSQAFRAAQLASGLADEDRKQAKAALLPSLNGFSQYIYTQPNGTPSGVWVPNDGPNIYAMWLNVHGDVFSYAKWAEYRSAAAAGAVARAKADVAVRGLVATIVQDYYGLVASQR
jgi:outer membrane protein TolC